MPVSPSIPRLLDLAQAACKAQRPFIAADALQDLAEAVLLQAQVLRVQHAPPTREQRTRLLSLYVQIGAQAIPVTPPATRTEAQAIIQRLLAELGT